jgi:hypothetical protein
MVLVKDVYKIWLGIGILAPPDISINSSTGGEKVSSPMGGITHWVVIRSLGDTT